MSSLRQLKGQYIRPMGSLAGSDLRHLYGIGMFACRKCLRRRGRRRRRMRMMRMRMRRGKMMCGAAPRLGMGGVEVGRGGVTCTFLGFRGRGGANFGDKRRNEVKMCEV